MKVTGSIERVRDALLALPDEHLAALVAAWNLASRPVLARYDWQQPRAVLATLTAGTIFQQIVTGAAVKHIDRARSADWGATSSDAWSTSLAAAIPELAAEALAPPVTAAPRPTPAAGAPAPRPTAPSRPAPTPAPPRSPARPSARQAAPPAPKPAPPAKPPVQTLRAFLTAMARTVDRMRVRHQDPDYPERVSLQDHDMTLLATHSPPGMEANAEIVAVEEVHGQIIVLQSVCVPLSWNPTRAGQYVSREILRSRQVQSLRRTIFQDADHAHRLAKQQTALHDNLSRIAGILANLTGGTIAPNTPFLLRRTIIAGPISLHLTHGYEADSTTTISATLNAEDGVHTLRAEVLPLQLPRTTRRLRATWERFRAELAAACAARGATAPAVLLEPLPPPTLSHERPLREDVDELLTALHHHINLQVVTDDGNRVIARWFDGVELWFLTEEGACDRVLLLTVTASERVPATVLSTYDTTRDALVDHPLDIRQSLDATITAIERVGGNYGWGYGGYGRSRGPLTMSDGTHIRLRRSWESREAHMRQMLKTIGGRLLGTWRDPEPRILSHQVLAWSGVELWFSPTPPLNGDDGFTVAARASETAASKPLATITLTTFESPEEVIAQLAALEARVRAGYAPVNAAPLPPLLVPALAADVHEHLALITTDEAWRVEQLLRDPLVAAVAVRLAPTTLALPPHRVDDVLGRLRKLGHTPKVQDK